MSGISRKLCYPAAIVSILFTLYACGGSGPSSSGDNGTNSSPVARIASPAEGGIYDAGTEIQFQGSCNDSGNGALGGASLVWASDADGQISTGEAFASGTLSAGAHKITLTCTDADGATGTDTVDVLITSATAGVYALTPDAQGYLVIPSTNTYRPGDTIYLSGNFKSVAVYDLMGSAAEPVTITNAPGQAATIGDQAWSGGSWAQGLVFRGSHYVDLYGSSQGDFKITGSTSTVPDSNGYPVRTAYIDLAISETSDNFTVHDITITGGGAGLWAKTEVSATDAGTWYPNTYLDNFEFYNLDISNTYNEAMYIGHTATYWNIDTNTPYYPSSPADTTASSNPTVYKQPIKLRNVKIHDDYIHDIGNDGIQTAAIEGLEVYNNEVTNWATKHGAADNGGILIGGRVKGFDVHDNYVHDSWGELMQVYAEDEADGRHGHANPSRRAIGRRSARRPAPASHDS